MPKTLDAFSFEAQPNLDRDAVLQVFDWCFVAKAANVVFAGGVGGGKTHLSIALGMACRQHDYRVRFVTPGRTGGPLPPRPGRGPNRRCRFYIRRFFGGRFGVARAVLSVA